MVVNIFVIITYDVNEKRVAKVCKHLRKFLSWTQNSVFEGEITKGTLDKCLSQLKNIIDLNEDSVYLYKVKNPNHLDKEIIGQFVEQDKLFL